MIDFLIADNVKFFMGLTFEDSNLDSLKDIVLRPFDESKDFSKWEPYRIL